MVNPRGVSSHHVLQRAFGDAYMRREKVRHATLFFVFGGGKREMANARKELTNKIGNDTI